MRLKTEFLSFRKHMVAIIKNTCFMLLSEVHTSIHGVGKIRSLWRLKQVVHILITVLHWLMCDVMSFVISWLDHVPLRAVLQVPCKIFVAWIFPPYRRYSVTALSRVYLQYDGSLPYFSQCRNVSHQYPVGWFISGVILIHHDPSSLITRFPSVGHMKIMEYEQTFKGCSCCKMLKCLWRVLFGLDIQ